MKVNFFFKKIKNAFYILVSNWNQLFELGDPKDFSRKFTKFAIFQGKKPLNLPYLLDIARF
jgi:hypothetical protein